MQISKTVSTGSNNSAKAAGSPSDRQSTFGKRASSDSNRRTVCEKELANSHKHCDVKGIFNAKFVWNKRECAGTALHVAVLHSEYDNAERLCNDYEELISKRFTYESAFKGTVQEGSGECIHLAASKGDVKMVEFLISRKADTTAMVTRGGKDHYNALHAAAFADGNKLDDSPLVDVVKLLLEHKAPMVKNADGRTPLHIAYQTGAKAMIQAIQENHEFGPESSNTINRNDLATQETTALEHGFVSGNLSYEELTALAPLTPASLHVLLKHGPRCLPQFLERIDQQIDNRIHDHITDETRRCQEYIEFVEQYHVDVSFLCELFGKHGASAVHLLEWVTRRPVEANQGHHPLPSRLSTRALNSGFNTLRTFLLKTFNHRPNILAFYKGENLWDFDSTTFTPPPWHKNLKNLAPPTLDIVVKVCCIPGLVCAEIFHALVEATEPSSEEPGHLHLFSNEVLDALVDWTWWNAAWKFDLLQVALNLTGLVQISLGMFGQQPSSVGTLFVGARSVVDLALELMEFAGYAAIGQAWAYIQFENFMNIATACPIIALLFDPGNLLLQSATVLVYWVRLLGIFRCAEKVAMVLMPIQRSTYSVFPALVITIVFFIGMTQAVSVFAIAAQEDGEKHEIVRQTLFEQFGILFAASYPQNQKSNELMQMVLYVGILFFTIGLLNIFISVISESYMLEMEKAKLTFIRERACGCLTFLLRTRVLPVNAMPLPFSICLSSVSLGLLIALFRGVEFGLAEIPVSIAAVAILNVVVLQHRSGEWPTARNPQPRKHYLWVAAFQDMGEHTMGQLAAIRAIVREECYNQIREEMPGIVQEALEQFCMEADDLATGDTAGGSISFGLGPTAGEHPTSITSILRQRKHSISGRDHHHRRSSVQHQRGVRHDTTSSRKSVTFPTASTLTASIDAPALHASRSAGLDSVVEVVDEDRTDNAADKPSPKQQNAFSMPSQGEGDQILQSSHSEKLTL